MPFYTRAIYRPDNEEYRLSDSKIFRVKRGSGGFTVNLYRNTAEINRVNKSAFLEDVGSITGFLRDECEITSPAILIEYDSVPNFNYVYIEVFHRYYFVTAVTSVRTDLWRISLKTDVLMSYKDKILDLSGIIGRQENDYNPELNDSMIPCETSQDAEIIDIPSDVFDPGFIMPDPTHPLELDVPRVFAITVID